MLTTLQHHINKQISQRYRNTRKRSSDVKCPKLVLPHSRETESCQDTTTNDAEDEENVEALKKLIASKNPPAQTIQEMLNATRAYRLQWLKKPDISIGDIIEKFPALKLPKWVSVNEWCLYYS